MSSSPSPAAPPAVHLVRADTPALLAQAHAVFSEYAASLSVDLGFQHFAAELECLPGAYAAPEGRLLLAFVDAALAGCGALCPRRDAGYANACEMKRLYVRPAFRRFGLGRTLAQELLDEARRIGYDAVLLDTLDDMEAARELYASLGFEAIPPYYYNPIAGAHYLKTQLD